MRCLPALTVVLLVGCIPAAQVAIAPDASRVVVGTRPPDGAYEQVGRVSATHGGGCGWLGKRGNSEGAQTLLRNKAAKLGADYVQILSVTEPNLDFVCAEGAFVIDGMAYRAASSQSPQATTVRPEPVAVVPGSGLSGTFAGQISGIQGDRQFSMGVSFTIVQTENKITGAWTATGGTSGTVTATIKGDALVDVRLRQINPCEGEFAGVAAIEGGGLRLRGSYLGSGCGSPVNASFIVNRQR